MSDFNFDTAPSRVGTDSQKWQKYAGRDILPLWVADMDFVSAPAIVEAIQQRAAHGIFGYARPVASTTAGRSIRPGWSGCRASSSASTSPRRPLPSRATKCSA